MVFRKHTGNDRWVCIKRWICACRKIFRRWDVCRNAESRKSHHDSSNKTSSETVFAKIIQLVEEAQNTPTQTASFIERIENNYVKLILLAVPLMILLPLFPRLELGWKLLSRNGIISCGFSLCACRICYTSFSSCSFKFCKNGILIKGGIHLEKLSELKAIAFDKTGTLTKGKPVVTDSFFFDEKDLAQQLLVAMEQKRRIHLLMRFCNISIAQYLKKSNTYQ